MRLFANQQKRRAHNKCERGDYKSFFLHQAVSNCWNTSAGSSV
jgi:hypothetical protein